MGYHWLDEENLAIYLLDVAGHGLGSALLSVSALNVLRSESLPDADFLRPEEVLHAINTRFCTVQHQILFFTLWYGVYNRRSRMLRYASAGHPPAALLIPGEADCIPLRTPAMAIGILPAAKYVGQEVFVPDGSLLHVFSDGVFEFLLPQGEMFDLRSFLALIAHQNRLRCLDENPLDHDHIFRAIYNLKRNTAFADDLSFLTLFLE